ncbi:MAG: U32 family peptidase [Clostridia bacterium]|nr:U32 family peptidase [Clostridia bacterium]
MPLNMPELLCPAGSFDALRAAVLGGADAVYLGAPRFNARMRAKNFDDETLKKGIDFCHEKGVRVYVTVNTLLTDRQMPDALALAADLWEMGADALIVADLGLARVLREQLPDLPLHASTQASGHSVGAAELFRKIGFSRMVCAREMDRENLKELCEKSPIPVEMFIHGAICACHSGQCLMSSMIGGRSGNRGECAQPCRLPYNGKYPISFKDLCLAGHMREILSLGVASLKVEGRMKSPRYVYEVASVYRRLLDEGRDASPREIESLRNAFSRSGFTDGYFTGKIDGSMLGIRREEDKDKSRAASQVMRDLAPIRKPVVYERAPVKPVCPPLPPEKQAPSGVSYRFSNGAQIPPELMQELCFLPLDRYVPGVRGVVMPAVVFPRAEKDVLNRLRRAKDQGATDLLITNPGQLPLVRDEGFVLHGDFRLNVTNSFAPLAFDGVADFIVSPELNPAQIRDPSLPKTVLIYGKLPLMLLEKPVGGKTLRDRRGVVFPVIREGKRDLLLNAVPVYMLDKKEELDKMNAPSRHLFFTTETPGEVRGVLNAYRRGEAPKGAVRRIK